MKKRVKKSLIITLATISIISFFTGIFLRIFPLFSFGLLLTIFTEYLKVEKKLSKFHRFLRILVIILLIINILYFLYIPLKIYESKKIDEVFSRLTEEEWAERLEECGAYCSRVNIKDTTGETWARSYAITVEIEPKCQCYDKNGDLLMEWKIFRDTDYSELAIEMQDITICDNLYDEWERKSCKFNYQVPRE